MIIIVGAGPAGMMAAVQAASHNAEVLLLEKNDCLGKKLRITGGGRCNLTCMTDNIEELIGGYPGNPAFLFSAFHQLDNLQLLDWFHAHGLATVVERGKRVFPAGQKALEVVLLFEKLLAQLKVKIRFKTKVTRILTEAGDVTGVDTAEGEIYKTRTLIFTPGGASYPLTGSNGEGYPVLRQAGHDIITPLPSLVPLQVEEVEDALALQGLSLRNVRAALFSGSKPLQDKFGEMLFTHYGVSGPIILFLSRAAVNALHQGAKKLTLALDLKPALSKEKLYARLERDFNAMPRKFLIHALKGLLPSSLIPVILKRSGLSPERKAQSLNQPEKHKLVDALKGFSFTVTSSRPLKEAEVTQGGVPVNQVNPRTMESLRLKGLYLAGEVLDVDGYIGGFNLQAAFSTGYVAGTCAAERQASFQYQD
jgi:predicted Rossmann fold flavoprotein